MTKVTTTRRPRRSPGEGSVFREGDGFRAKLTLPDGRVLRQRGKTKAEARAKLDKARASVTLGIPVGSTEHVGAFLEWWLDVQEAKVGTGQGDLSLNTWLNFKWALGPVIETLGKYRLAELEPEHVEGLLAKLAREGKARGSVTRVRTVLGQALEVAMRRGKVSRNVAKLSEMPKTAPPPEKRALTVEQAEALLEAAQGDPVECFIIVGLTTGLRPGELLGLRWDDVDLDAATLEVTGSLKREGSTLRLGGVKGGLRRARRRLDLTARAVEALRSHRGAQRQQRLLVGPDWEDLGFVFPTEVGTPPTRAG